MGLRIRINGSNKDESHAPVSKCLEYAADRMGMDTFRAALLMSYFFEEMAERIADSELVNIPGFGAFGASSRPSGPGGVKMVPHFSPSRNLRAMVIDRVPLRAPVSVQLYSHGLHNFPKVGQVYPSSSIPHIAFRNHVRSQASQYGIQFDAEKPETAPWMKS